MEEEVSVPGEAGLLAGAGVFCLLLNLGLPVVGPLVVGPGVEGGDPSGRGQL